MRLSSVPQRYGPLIRVSDPTVIQGTGPPKKRGDPAGRGEAPRTTLHMLPSLTGADRQIAENIVSRATTSFPYFKNRYGYPYYGFWPTNAIIMPHTLIFKYLKQVFGQGEDAWGGS